MIPGISITEILTLTSILFFIGIYGFITRTNLISMLISVEIILNSTVINFVIINKYLYPELLQGVVYGIFIIAVAAAETALAVAIIINLYKQISSVEVKETETLKY
ncbi:MAG: NADH-quinone oxidoreductase subunit NuoK [Salegentibacter sp.]|uniref:NADH-quinone oxidoreductase subunit K n=1 Tax=Salegentibacter flavus TaxID=287099 RepID=A0A1I5AMV3_9FLAO|nr:MULTISPECIES: NADH-quinone oxidoreductase subunit NuoK [Salegentibacter]MDR9456598.1 NADH-quinone oxidoreductase subunit NuoK [Salegentibacter sp.]SFN63690.1 NADH-quinone oxidoreductase subunit K [Salegentibacter flavus]